MCVYIYIDKYLYIDIDRWMISIYIYETKNILKNILFRIMLSAK